MSNDLLVRRVHDPRDQKKADLGESEEHNPLGNFISDFFDRNITIGMFFYKAWYI